jgi:hypothetical protein
VCRTGIPSRPPCISCYRRNKCSYVKPWFVNASVTASAFTIMKCVSLCNEYGALPSHTQSTRTFHASRCMLERRATNESATQLSRTRTEVCRLVLSQRTHNRHKARTQTYPEPRARVGMRREASEEMDTPVPSRCNRACLRMCGGRYPSVSEYRPLASVLSSTMRVLPHMKSSVKGATAPGGYDVVMERTAQPTLWCGGWPVVFVSVTSTTKVEGPVLVGLPLIVPVEVFKVSPAGSVPNPFSTDHV